MIGPWRTTPKGRIVRLLQRLKPPLLLNDDEDDNRPDDNGESSQATNTSAPSTPDATEPAEEEEDDRGFFDRAGDFFGGLARDVQDFSRENPRVDSHGNPVGLVDADGIQRGEVASRVRSSGTSAEDLAEQLGFSSPQDMAAAQNTDFIDDKYQEELARRAIEEALSGRRGHPSDIPGLDFNPYALGFAPQAEALIDQAYLQDIVFDEQPPGYTPPGFFESGLYAFRDGIVNFWDDIVSRPLGTVGEMLNSLGPGGAVFGILGAGTRAAGKYAERAASAVAKGLINHSQAGNFARFEKKLPSAAEETRIFDLPDGGKVFQAEVPGRVPGSKAVYEKSVDVNGKTIEYNKTTYDPSGDIVHVKKK